MTNHKKKIFVYLLKFNLFLHRCNNSKSKEKDIKEQSQPKTKSQCFNELTQVNNISRMSLKVKLCGHYEIIPHLRLLNPDSVIVLASSDESPDNPKRRFESVFIYEDNLQYFC
jgi:hypothetical protein